MTKYILSVDGGGIRGIIPATILAEIEKKARKPTSEIFDLVAGTSTGGIIAAGLCKKNQHGGPLYSAHDLVDFYQEHGPHIFKSSFFKRSVLSWIHCPRYSPKYIESVLDRYFGDDILQNALTNVMLTSYDVQNNCPFFLKSWKPGNIMLKDACRATSAAPTYFPPKYLNLNDKEMVLIDGGVFANNPAACAYASSKSLFPNDDVVLLSLGTGRTEQSIAYANSKHYGKVKWIKPLIHVMFNSSSDEVDYQLNQHIADQYMRIESTLKIASPDMDNTTSKNMEALQEEAYAIMERNRNVIDKFCSIVS